MCGEVVLQCVLVMGSCPIKNIGTNVGNGSTESLVKLKQPRCGNLQLWRKQMTFTVKFIFSKILLVFFRQGAQLLLRSISGALASCSLAFLRAVFLKTQGWCL